MRKNNKKGFTLVELLVVIAILAILASVAVVGYTAFIEKAEQSNAETEAHQIQTAADSFHMVGDPFVLGTYVSTPDDEDTPDEDETVVSTVYLAADGLVYSSLDEENVLTALPTNITWSADLVDFAEEFELSSTGVLTYKDIVID